MQKPTDPWFSAYIAFFLQGIALMLAYNIFFTTSEFFSHRFKSSMFADNFITYFNFCFQIANLVFVTLAMARQHCANFHRQIYIGSVINGLVFVMLCVLTFWKLNAVPMFWIVMTLFAIASVVNAYLQNALYAIASRWGSAYVQALCSGQGLASVATAAVPLLFAVLADPASSQDGYAIARRALLCYIPSALLIFFALFSYFILRWHPMHERNRHLMNDEWGFTAYIKPEYIPKMNLKDMWYVAKDIKGLVAANFICWTVSVALFPAITGGVTHVNGPGGLNAVWANKEVFTLVHYLISSSGDWIGRVLAGFPKLRIHRTRSLVAFSILRVGFIILFLMCNTETPKTGARLLPLTINSDAAFLALVAAFALTNGWLSSVVFMEGPERMSSDSEKEAAGMVQSFSMTAGCFIGSLLSFAVRAAVCRCDPFTS